jgi:hypothetical protein
MDSQSSSQLSPQLTPLQSHPPSILSLSSPSRSSPFPTSLSTSRLSSFPTSLPTDPTQTVAICEQSSLRQFLEWWETTPWYKTNQQRPPKQQIGITWTTKGQRSTIWSYLNYCADLSGKPAVICSRCDKVLAHPNFTSNPNPDGTFRRNGISHLAVHLNSTSMCRLGSKKKGLPIIETLFNVNKAVSIILEIPVLIRILNIC